MTFLDTATANVAAGITHIGLGTSSTVEVTGGGYVRLVPSYGVDGVLDATLQFNGPAGTVATHLIFVNAGGTRFQVLAAPLTFNSDGRLDIDTAGVALS